MFFKGTIVEAMQRSEQLSWPLFLFVAATSETSVVERIVQEAQLKSAAVMQLVIVGTAEHTQLQALVSETQTPRVHVFAPKRCRAALPPLSLVGEHFTAAKVGEAVDLASEWNDMYVEELTQRLGKEAELVQKEAGRFRKVQEYEKNAKNAKPLFGKEAPPAAAAAPAPAARPQAVVATPPSKSTVPAPKEAAVPPAAKVSEVTRHEDPNGMIIECDGDVCRRVPSGPKGATPLVDKATATPSDQPSQAAASPTPAPAASTIAVRCQLPDGKQFVVESLTPEAPLESVRSVVEERLQHGDFSIYNSYPPKRFSGDDMSKSLKSLGLDRNAAVRIVMSTSLETNRAPTAAAPAGIIPTTAGRLAGIIRGVAGAFVGGGGGAAAAAAPADHSEEPRSGSNAPPQQQRPTTTDRPRVATLASLAQNGDEEKDSRKHNRYFGGTSTEYEGK